MVTLKILRFQLKRHCWRRGWWYHVHILVDTGVQVKTHPSYYTTKRCTGFIVLFTESILLVSIEFMSFIDIDSSGSLHWQRRQSSDPPVHYFERYLSSCTWIYHHRPATQYNIHVQISISGKRYLYFGQKLRRLLLSSKTSWPNGSCLAKVKQFDNILSFVWHRHSHSTIHTCRPCKMMTSEVES